MCTSQPAELDFRTQVGAVSEGRVSQILLLCSGVNPKYFLIRYHCSSWSSALLALSVSHWSVSHGVELSLPGLVASPEAQVPEFGCALDAADSTQFAVCKCVASNRRRRSMRTPSTRLGLFPNSSPLVGHMHVPQAVEREFWALLKTQLRDELPWINQTQAVLFSQP